MTNHSTDLEECGNSIVYRTLILSAEEYQSASNEAHIVLGVFLLSMVTVWTLALLQRVIR